VAAVSAGNEHTCALTTAGGVTQEWVARYDGPSNLWDYAHDVSVDSGGNVYVMGRSDDATTYNDYATVKYNASGVQQWAARYTNGWSTDQPGSVVVVDDSGNVYVTGQSNGAGTGTYDYVTVKYNSSGVQQWMASYNGTGNDWDTGEALAVDGSGNVYVTGESVGSGTGPYDYATVKYNASGVQQWAARYNGPGNGWDGAHRVVVDSLGNVYVTGNSIGTGTGGDYATVKYNSNGVQQWVARYNGTGNRYDQANALAVDGAGNVYVTGLSDGAGTNGCVSGPLHGCDDYATVKYNASGVQQWVARYDGPVSWDDDAYSLAVDATGNVYVTGTSYGVTASTYQTDYATVKYSSGGVQQWVTRYNGPANGLDEASELALDGAGNVYVTGGSAGVGTGDDYATVKYNASGVEQWTIRYDGGANADDSASALKVDGAGNVYVTGSSVGTPGTDGYADDDYVTVKYSQGGDGSPVGGIAELPEMARLAGSQSDSQSRGYIPLAALSVLALTTLAAGAWCSRRRWLR